MMMNYEIFLLGGAAFDQLDLVYRKIDDVDLLGNYDDIISYLNCIKVEQYYPIESGKKIFANLKDKIFECEIAWENTLSVKLIDLIKNDTGTKTFDVSGNDCVYKIHAPSLNILYMLKMSHRYLKNSPHFLKTLQDIEVMRYFGAVIQPEHEEFYKLRMKETYNYKHPKLNTRKKDFFRDTQIYRFEHDDIHKIVARLEKPAYDFYKPDTSEVNVSKELFFAADEKIRLYGAIEEVEVLALERSQIPNEFHTNPKKSFNTALEKVCTSITSGFFREFCWENYYKIQGMYDPQYVTKFRTAVLEKRIKPLEKIYG